MRASGSRTSGLATLNVTAPAPAKGSTARHDRAGLSKEPLRKNVLVVDIGGTSVKVLAAGHKVHRSFPSGPQMTPKQMVSGVRTIAKDWAYDVVSIGYPGPVLRGRPIGGRCARQVLDDSRAIAQRAGICGLFGSLGPLSDRGQASPRAAADVELVRRFRSAMLSIPAPWRR
jgi:hypothetical protein